MNIEKTQIFLLHYAGGSSYSYQFMKPYLEDFDCILLELPGRGRRMASEPLIDFEKAVYDLLKQVLIHLKTSKFIVYGHSMGAYMALRLVNLLEKKGCKPSHLIVTGSAGPKIKAKKKRYLLDNQDLSNEIKAMGGISNELLKSKEFMDYYLPIIRADFELLEKSDLVNEPPVSTPIIAIMGNQEEHYKQISQWQPYTTAQFDHEILKGNHFFIHEHAQYIASKIRECAS